MTKHSRECIKVCTEAGLSVERMEHGSRHIHMHTSKGMLVFPSTPSDQKWKVNMRSVARRLARS